MPNIPNIRGPYRIYFTSFDCTEPAHVHVRRERAKCKFWLNPLRLARSRGFSQAELRRIRDTILEHRIAILEVWHEHCGTTET